MGTASTSSRIRLSATIAATLAVPTWFLFVALTMYGRARHLEFVGDAAPALIGACVWLCSYTALGRRYLEPLARGTAVPGLQTCARRIFMTAMAALLPVSAALAANAVLVAGARSYADESMNFTAAFVSAALFMYLFLAPVYAVLSVVVAFAYRRVKRSYRRDDILVSTGDAPFTPRGTDARPEPAC